MTTDETRRRVIVLPDAIAIAQQATNEIIARAQAAIRARGRFTLALAGGGTPRPAYQGLAARVNEIDWARVHLFWGDERCVPPDHPDSNYRMADDALIRHVPIPSTQVHRMRGEDDPHQAAADYEAALRATFEAAPPGFDLILLGMGDDGHTASLFPGTPAVHEAERWVVGHHVPKLDAWRLTFTPVVLNAAGHVLFMAAGAGKAAPLHEVLEGNYRPDLYPSQVVAPINGGTTWLIDDAAAALLSPAVRGLTGQA
jgi:6-phosphogluconolactonase